jgi:phosphoribosyl-AMP cyclohydrolase
METKINSGSIFKNDKKTADNQPDYRGKINVEGKMWEISLWVKEGQQAGKFFSAAIKEPWVKPEESGNTPNIKPITDEDDDLPF